MLDAAQSSCLILGNFELREGGRVSVRCDRGWGTSIIPSLGDAIVGSAVLRIQARFLLGVRGCCVEACRQEI